jgi:hypothetical protein
LVRANFFVAEVGASAALTGLLVAAVWNAWVLLIEILR